jgi:peptide/nickel transport system substrate-binding protein
MLGGTVMKKVIIVVFMLVVITSLVLGCTQSTQSTIPSAQPAKTSQPGASVAPPPSTQPTTSTPSKQYGGILKIIQNNGPVQFGYSPTLTAADGNASTPALETLIEFDELAQPVPILAKSWEIDPNKKYIIFHLRQGVKFHDGTDFNAAAAKYNIEARIKAIPGEIQGINSIDVIDDYTLRLNLEKLATTIFTSLTMVRISSPTYLESVGEGAKLHPVGTGPFEFSEFKRDTYLKYKKFNNYWDKGKPYLDGIEYDYIADPMTAQAAFLSKTADVLYLSSLKQAKDMEAQGYNIKTLIVGLTGLAPDTNNANSPFASLKVREAVEYSLDKKAMAETLGYGYLKAIYQQDVPGMFGYNDKIAGRQYDPAKAKKLLEEAGFPQGFSTTLICSTQYSDRDYMASVQNYLSTVGIKAQLDFADPGRWSDWRRKSGWTGLLFMHGGWGPNVVESINLGLSKSRNDYVSTARPAGTEELLQQMLFETDFNKQTAVVQQIMQLLYDNAFHCPLYARYMPCAFSNKVHDTGIYKVMSVFWTPADAWLSK